MWLPRRLKLGSCASLQQAACYMEFPRLHCGILLCQITLCGASYPRGMENSSQRIFASLPVVFSLCPVPTKMKKNEISEAAFYIHEIKKPSRESSFMHSDLLCCKPVGTCCVHLHFCHHPCEYSQRSLVGSQMKCWMATKVNKTEAHHLFPGLLR